MKTALFGAAAPLLLMTTITLSGCGIAQQPTSRLAGDDSAECYEGDAFECAAEAEVIRLTNIHRQENSRADLAISGHMSFTSRAWSDVQAARGSIGHDGFPGQRTNVYTAEFGSMEGKWIAGENVAYFSGGVNMTAEQAAAYLVNMWWNSSGHRANMVGGFKGIGAGVVRTSSGAVFGTQIFYQLN